MAAEKQSIQMWRQVLDYTLYTDDDSRVVTEDEFFEIYAAHNPPSPNRFKPNVESIQEEE
jgi:hypothetical protein